MYVDIAEAGKIKHPLRDNPPIRDNDDGFWSNGFQLGAQLRVVLDALRLEDRKAETKSKLLDRRKLEFLFAAGRAVRLGEGQGDFVASVDEGLQAGDGEFRGSAEDEFHGSPRSFGAYHSPCF